MAYGENQKNATIKYQKERMHRIPLSVKNDIYDRWKSEADQRGESLNGMIKKAVEEFIK